MDVDDKSYLPSAGFWGQHCESVLSEALMPPLPKQARFQVGQGYEVTAQYTSSLTPHYPGVFGGGDLQAIDSAQSDLGSRDIRIERGNEQRVIKATVQANTYRTREVGDIHNARERKRRRAIVAAYDELRDEILPIRNCKLTKIATLTVAKTCISELKEQVVCGSKENASLKKMLNEKEMINNYLKNLLDEKERENKLLKERIVQHEKEIRYLEGIELLVKK